MITIIESEDDFLQIADLWHKLDVSSARVSQTWEWCYWGWITTLRKDKGNRLWILKWHRDGVDDCVIFPFYIDNRGTLRFLMDMRANGTDCVCLPGHNRHWCYREAAEIILKEKRIKRVFLQRMVTNTEAFGYLSIFLKGASVYKDNAYSWLSVPKSEDFIAHHNQLKSKDKADLRAIRRKAAPKGIKIYSAGNGDSFPRDAVYEMRDSMIGGRRKNTSFLTDLTINFAEKLYESHYIDIVKLDDIGLNFIQTKGTRRLSWIFLYRDPHASTELYIKYLEQECRKSDFLFDFGIGVYDYKLGTFRPDTAATCAIALGKSKFDHLMLLKDMLLRMAKDYLKGHCGWKRR